MVYGSFLYAFILVYVSVSSWLFLLLIPVLYIPRTVGDSGMGFAAQGITAPR